jgi:mono/diheme cytochrome c family protein
MHWTSVCFASAMAAAMAIAMVSSPAAGQSSATETTRTTAAGVYTAEQAARGRDTYLMQCKSCHTPESHTGPVFASWWDRKPLSELYYFIATRMPKNEPGSLQPQEYIEVVAYLLKLNDMPSGSDELRADSVALKKIRIDAAKRN